MTKTEEIKAQLRTALAKVIADCEAAIVADDEEETSELGTLLDALVSDLHTRATALLQKLEG